MLVRKRRKGAGGGPFGHQGAATTLAGMISKERSSRPISPDQKIHQDFEKCLRRKFDYRWRCKGWKFLLTEFVRVHYANSVMKRDRACTSGFIPCAIVSSGRGGYRGCQPLKAERRKLRHQPSPGKGQWGFGLYGYVKKTASSRTSQAVIRQGVTAVLSYRNNGVGTNRKKMYFIANCPSQAILVIIWKYSLPLFIFNHPNLLDKRE